MNIHGAHSYWKQSALGAAGIRRVRAGAGPHRAAYRGGGILWRPRAQLVECDVHGVCSRGGVRRGSTLAEFAQLPTSAAGRKLSVTQLPYCYDEHMDTGSDVIPPHACALYACHLDPQLCQQQRMRGAQHFICDTDSSAI